MQTENPRQTLSYLRHLFQERGVRPKNKLGQNFLIDLNLLDLIARRAELTREDLAIEVGTGTGSLTTRLIEHAGAVASIEIDPDLHALAQDTIGERENVRLIHADILKNKNRLNPSVLDELEALRQQADCTRYKLVANLPYVVATPVISNFLLTELPFELMVVTVQWEIAERLMARPGSKDYGALAVLVQSLAEVELVRKLPPAVFFPRPQVASAIVAILPRPEKRARVVEQVGDVHRFRNFLRDLYSHRRKNLRGALVSMPSGGRPKAEVDRQLAELGFTGGERAEDLSIEDHLRLCAVFG